MGKKTNWPPWPSWKPFGRTKPDQKMYPGIRFKKMGGTWWWLK